MNKPASTASREAAAESMAMVVATINYALSVARSDNPDYRREYTRWMRASRDAALTSIDEIQIAMLESGMKNKKHIGQEGSHKLTCEACGVEFYSKQANRRTCYKHRLADIGSPEFSKTDDKENP